MFFSVALPLEVKGSRLHQEYVGQIEGCNVVLLYDEDAAGYKRRDQWKDLLQDVVGAIKVVKLLYVDGKMPANLMQERIDKLVKGFGVDLYNPSYFRLITPDLQEEGIADISTEYGQSPLNGNGETSSELLGGQTYIIYSFPMDSINRCSCPNR